MHSSARRTVVSHMKLGFKGQCPSGRGNQAGEKPLWPNLAFFKQPVFSANACSRSTLVSLQESSIVI